MAQKYRIERDDKIDLKRTQSSFSDDPKLNKAKQVSRRKDDVKNIQVGIYDIDLAFTSPPYFDRERYSEDKEQSCIKFPNYKDWCEGFYEPMIKTYFDYLKPKGHLLLNVADTKMSDGSYVPIEQTTIEFCVKQGFKYLGNIPMVMSRMIGVKTDKVKNNYFDSKNKKVYKTEPTLCFVKE